MPSATPADTIGPARPTAPAAIASAPPLADSAFIFDSSPCGIGRLDTFRGTFTRGPHRDVWGLVRLRLSRAELEDTYGTMREIDVFSYPRTYAIPLPRDGMGGSVVPAPKYYLKARIGGRTEEVRRHDEITDPNPPRARELPELMRLLDGTIAARPEAHTYREAATGCGYCAAGLPRHNP